MKIAVTYPGPLQYLRKLLGVVIRPLKRSAFPVVKEKPSAHRQIVQGLLKLTVDRDRSRLVALGVEAEFRLCLDVNQLVVQPYVIPCQEYKLRSSEAGVEQYPDDSPHVFIGCIQDPENLVVVKVANLPTAAGLHLLEIGQGIPHQLLPLNRLVQDGPYQSQIMIEGLRAAPPFGTLQK